MNLPTGDHATGLMEHSEVETFLHEYRPPAPRHVRRPEPALGRPERRRTEWDFVEAPSQMLENWVYDYDTLKGFAVNAKGKPIPRDWSSR